LIVTFLGLALGNWGSLALAAVVPTAGSVYRIRFENARCSTTAASRTGATPRAALAWLPASGDADLTGERVFV